MNGLHHNLLDHQYQNTHLRDRIQDIDVDHRIVFSFESNAQLCDMTIDSVESRLTATYMFLMLKTQVFLVLTQLNTLRLHLFVTEVKVQDFCQKDPHSFVYNGIQLTVVLSLRRQLIKCLGYGTPTALNASRQ
uniref:Uncharacterized protein n=1 Tax=Schistosoma haematobium TaxID=6185 RepID=A0A094ZZC3_SCHHA